MLRELQRYLFSCQLVEVIYLDRAGQISQRQLKLLRFKGEQVVAYCFARQAIRTFAISNILAITAVRWKKGA